MIRPERELAAELRRRCLDPVQRSGCDHAQDHAALVWPVHPDALFLKHVPEHHGIPEGGALDRQGHVHDNQL
jgi:hypothetical protein